MSFYANKIFIIFTKTHWNLSLSSLKRKFSIFLIHRFPQWFFYIYSPLHRPFLYSLVLTLWFFRMSKKSDTFPCSNLVYKNGQHFLDIQHTDTVFMPILDWKNEKKTVHSGDKCSFSHRQGQKCSFCPFYEFRFLEKSYKYFQFSEFHIFLTRIFFRSKILTQYFSANFLLFSLVLNL